MLINETQNGAEIHILGEIGWETTGDYFTATLKRINGKALTVYISSLGGSVIDAMQIYNAIKNYGGEKRAVLSGFVASAATYIAMAFPRVDAEENTIFMIHNSSTFAEGNAEELTKTAEVLRKIDSALEAAYVAKTKRDAKCIRAYLEEETYFTAAEALDAGFIDGIIADKEQRRAVALANAKAIRAAAATLNKRKKMEPEKNATTATPAPTDNVEPAPAPVATDAPEQSGEQKPAEPTAPVADVEGKPAETAEQGEHAETPAPAPEPVEPAPDVAAKARAKIKALVEDCDNAEVRTLAIDALASDAPDAEAFAAAACKVLAAAAKKAKPTPSAFRAAIASQKKSAADIYAEMLDDPACTQAERLKFVREHNAELFSSLKK